MNNGRIKWFNAKNRFGFISTEGGDDIFVHVTGLAEGYKPKTDDEVTFDIEAGKKGPIAVNVRPQ